LEVDDKFIVFICLLEINKIWPKIFKN